MSHTLQLLPLFHRAEGSSLVSFLCCEVILLKSAACVSLSSALRSCVQSCECAKLQMCELAQVCELLHWVYSSELPSLASTFTSWMSQDSSHELLHTPDATFTLPHWCWGFKDNMTTEIHTNKLFLMHSCHCEKWTNKKHYSNSSDNHVTC